MVATNNVRRTAQVMLRPIPAGSHNTKTFSKKYEVKMLRMETIVAPRKAAVNGVLGFHFTEKYPSEPYVNIIWKTIYPLKDGILKKPIMKENKTVIRILAPIACINFLILNM